MLEGHHLVEDSARQAHLKSACWGLHWGAVAADGESVYSNYTLPKWFLATSRWCPVEQICQDGKCFE